MPFWCIPSHSPLSNPCTCYSQSGLQVSFCLSEGQNWLAGCLSSQSMGHTVRGGEAAESSTFGAPAEWQMGLAWVFGQLESSKHTRVTWKTGYMAYSGILMWQQPPTEVGKLCKILSGGWYRTICFKNYVSPSLLTIRNWNETWRIQLSTRSKLNSEKNRSKCCIGKYNTSLVWKRETSYWKTPQKTGSIKAQS